MSCQPSSPALPCSLLATLSPESSEGRALTPCGIFSGAQSSGLGPRGAQNQRCVQSEQVNESVGGKIALRIAFAWKGKQGRQVGRQLRRPSLPVTPARQEPSFGGRIAPVQFHGVVELVKREKEHENASTSDARVWKASGKEATPISFESRECLVWHPREVLPLAKESHERKGQAGNLRQALPKSVSSGAR